MSNNTSSNKAAVPEAKVVNGLIVPGFFFYSIPGVRRDRKSTRLNSSHIEESRMPSSA